MNAVYLIAGVLILAAVVWVMFTLANIERNGKRAAAALERAFPKMPPQYMDVTSRTDPHRVMVPATRQSIPRR